MRILKDGRTRLLTQRVLGIVIAWTIMGGLDALNTMAIVGSDLVMGEAAYSWSYYLMIKLATAFVAGIWSGSMLVFFLRERFRNQTFGVALLINSTIISLLNFGIIAIVYQFFLTIDYIQTGFLLKSLILWSLVAVFTIIFLHVNDKYGQGIFFRLLLGRYHKPREEERIFMFVDLKSSTTIAEELGHIKFFDLLNDFFRDITNSIIYAQGEIYQYVGDEIVISWSMKKGVNRANCVRCYYSMQEAIQRQADHYHEKYDLVPQFKAGLHCGTVTTGEIGVIKKDIVYSGDVLNTTARIEAVCNLYGVKLLISKYLLERLQLPPNEYPIKHMGIIELRGKKRKIELYTFEDCFDDQLSVPQFST